MLEFQDGGFYHPRFGRPNAQFSSASADIIINPVINFPSKFDVARVIGSKVIPILPEFQQDAARKGSELDIRCQWTLTPTYA